MGKTMSCRLPIAVLAVALLLPGVNAGELSANGCRVSWGANSLTVGNSHFSRSYAVSNGVLRTVSLKAVEGVEWQKSAVAAAGREALEVEAASAKWSPVGVEGVRALVKFGEGRSAEIWLFPDMPGVIVKRSWTTETGGALARDVGRAFDRRNEDSTALKGISAESDFISYGPMHVKATDMTCLDQTDIRDNLFVSTERVLAANDRSFATVSTALDCRDVLTGDGLLFLRMAPMPASRSNTIEDFILDGNRRMAILANGYPLAELAYRGGEAGMRRASVAFQRAIRPYRSGRDGVLLSNTWGGGNADSRINQDFLLKEIEAGARMGVDVIQVDDGWQHGRTPASMKKANKGGRKAYSGYWDADPDFWKEDRERFPDGLGFLADKAREKGMRFGLWFGPDSSGEVANWEKDAACLLDYHRRFGIDYFKMDTMNMPTLTAQTRGRMMFDRMLEESGGAMVFDLDCTAGVRGGYWGVMDVGPVFVENRYQNSVRYWPHHTLKNLWDLSHLVDSVRLRMEFCNPDICRKKYAASPLSYANYRPDAIFATVMAASPLAWMELSDVSEASMASFAPLIAKWKQERDRWYGGVIHPVANRPDGVSWTGFVSEAQDGGGYALLFRELSGDEEYTLDLRPIFGASPLAVAGVVGGRGDANVAGGQLTVRIPEKLDFVWVKLAALK